MKRILIERLGDARTRLLVEENPGRVWVGEPLVNLAPVKVSGKNFALLVVDAYRFLLRKKEFVLSKQFLRAGTSIGANVHGIPGGSKPKGFCFQDVDCFKRSKRKHPIGSGF